MSKAADDVLAERARQMSAEGWTTDHDDTHDAGEMACAAACYAVNSAVPLAVAEPVVRERAAAELEWMGRGYEAYLQVVLIAGAKRIRTGGTP